MKRKLLSTLLALCMMLTLLPTAALADEGGTGDGVTTQTGSHVAKIDWANETKYYTTLEAAINAVNSNSTNTTPTTITMLKNVDNAEGMKVDGGKNIVVDFANYTYTVNKPGEGSSGTETNGFQFLQGSTIVFKNGTIQVSNDNLTQVTNTSNGGNIKLLIMNYSNLTLENMIVDGTNLYQAHYGTGKDRHTGPNYTISNVCGQVSIKNSTIKMKTSANADNYDGPHYAFDVDYKDTYSTGAQVTVENSTIIGNIDVPEKVQAETCPSNLTIKSGSFTDLASAVKYAESGATIKLAEDVTLNAFLSVTQKLTIDLAGKEISRNNNNTTIFVDGGELEIKDSVGNGKVENIYCKEDNTPDGMAVYISNSGKVTLTSGILEGSAIGVVVANEENPPTAPDTTNNVTFVMNGGTVKGNIGISGRGNKWDGGSTIDINGGTIQGTAVGIYHPQGGTMTVDDVAISGGTAVYVKSGTVTINSATLNGTLSPSSYYVYNGNGVNATGDALLLDCCGYPSGAPSVTIAGGAFSGTKSGIGVYEYGEGDNEHDSHYSLSVTGGTFSTDPSAYVANGYYVVTNGDGTYTVYKYSSGGSSSSSSNTTSSTVKNPDGSTTTTTTNKTTGTTTEVTKNTDGSVDTVVTKKDGSTTESTKTAGGTTATVETNKSGDTTSVSASVSSADAKSANKSGDSVSLPLSGVTPAASSAEAQTIDIDVPSNVSSVTVEIPVEDVTPGTVVIIVNKDGTETIVPTSTVTENGIQVTLTEDATVKIVDNSREFKDVPESSVFYDEIASMSARGIMVGKTDDYFDLYSNVTLNQIANVAGRVSGAVATEDYEGGIAWGEANGLSTGDAPATRGQVILALYVAAGSPDAMDTGKLSAYSDGASVPSELLSAVLWAVENGILKGTDAGTLDLGANVTRGQAAAFAGRTLSVIG